MQYVFIDHYVIPANKIVCFKLHEEMLEDVTWYRLSVQLVTGLWIYEEFNNSSGAMDKFNHIKNCIFDNKEY